MKKNVRNKRKTKKRMGNLKFESRISAMSMIRHIRV